jgi:hypothetical protein
MVCNSPQGVDGPVAWGTGGMYGISVCSLGNREDMGHVIQAYTGDAEFWRHHGAHTYTLETTGTDLLK